MEKVYSPAPQPEDEQHEGLAWLQSKDLQTSPCASRGKGPVIEVDPDEVDEVMEDFGSEAEDADAEAFELCKRHAGDGFLATSVAGLDPPEDAGREKCQKVR